MAYPFAASQARSRLVIHRGCSLRSASRRLAGNRSTADPIFQNSALLGYLKKDQIADVSLGQLGLEPVDGNFKLRLQPESSPHLGLTPFQPVGNPVEWIIPAANKAFLRVRGSTTHP